MKQSRVGGTNQADVGAGEWSRERRDQENKGVRRKKGSEEQRGQESGRAMEDNEDGGASPPFIRPFILLLYLHLHMHSLYFSRTFPHSPLHYTVVLDSGGEASYVHRQARGMDLALICRLAASCSWPCDGISGLRPLLNEEKIILAHSDRPTEIHSDQLKATNSQ